MAMRRLVGFLLLCGVGNSLSPLRVAAQGVSVRYAPPVVRTKDGAVRGIVAASGVHVFRGIPFAAPPVGDLRWKAPQPTPKWSGARAANRFAAQCMQRRVFDDMVFRNAGTSEDCLYLNVWVPPTGASTRRPVLVYFYGGGFSAGDGSEPRYDGERMAARGIVVVTMSYRLGIFGFLAHPELSAESPGKASGNYGLMDQWAALRWVRDNIAAFGGDPAQVTIAGESAGSFSVTAQMVSPRARGLFARAIGESGAFLTGAPLADAVRQGATFGASLGATSLGDLRALSAMELLAATARPGTPGFRPIVDGWFITEAPTATFAAGRQARVPLLAGWNSEESSWRALLRTPPTSDSARAVFARVFGDKASEAARHYPIATDAEAMQSLTDLAGDQFIGHGTWKWLDEHARTGGQPVWRYFYARPRPTPTSGSNAPLPTGAVHSAEIEYAMGNLALNRAFAWTPDDHRVSATMQGYFANFITSGDPNGAGLPTWPPGAVDASGVARRMRIDVDSRSEDEPRGRYLLLDSVGFMRRR
ncbi:MAG TPA: carboxylesterase family protein [Gemmatimonadaceae bacterium]|nr:carboxylesterase family protein [Gemmatimonadaceae bacterium]